MREWDYEAARAEANGVAIGRISAMLLCDPVERVRMDKIMLRLEEKRGRVAGFAGAKIRCCGTPGCREQAHWTDSEDFPRRYASTARGRACLWVPDCVLPRYARRMHLDYRMVVYVGDAYRFHNGERCRSFAKWAWSIDARSHGEWDQAVACRVRLRLDDAEVEVSV